MLFRIVSKALIHRRGRVAVAGAALIVGAAVTAAMLSVYYDAGQKMSRELRAYGANVMLAPSGDNRFIDESAIQEIAGSTWPAQVAGAVPYLYVAATGSSESGGVARLVVAGTWFDEARKVNPWWQIAGRWIEDRRDTADCLVGAELAKQLRVAQGQSMSVTYGGAEDRSDESAPGPEAPGVGHCLFRVLGIVTTGGAEDGQVLVTLSGAQSLAALPGRVSAVAISAVGETDRVEALAREVSGRVEGVRAGVVRQIAESEGRVLSKLRLMMLLVTLLILAAAVLSVATTLTALIIERRPEIGTMKALGAEDGKLLRLFLLELGGLGLTGGLAGYSIGLVIAQAIGRSLFNSAVTPRPAVFGAVILISLGVALLSGLLPIRKIKEVAPAVILRGD